MFNPGVSLKNAFARLDMAGLLVITGFSSVRFPTASATMVFPVHNQKSLALGCATVPLPTA